MAGTTDLIDITIAVNTAQLQSGLAGAAAAISASMAEMRGMTTALGAALDRTTAMAASMTPAFARAGGAIINAERAAGAATAAPILPP